MYKNKSSKIVLGSILLLFILCCAIFYFLYNDIKTKNINSSTTLNTLSAQKEMQDYVFSTKKLLENVVDDTEVLKSFILAKDEDVLFIEGLESVAKNNNLTIVIDSLNIENTKELAPSGVAILKVKLKVKGSWASVYRFLSLTESLPVKTKTDKFVLIKTVTGQGQDSSASDVWEGVLDISVLKYI